MNRYLKTNVFRRFFSKKIHVNHLQNIPNVKNQEHIDVSHENYQQIERLFADNLSELPNSEFFDNLHEKQRLSLRKAIQHKKLLKTPPQNLIATWKCWSQIMFLLQRHQDEWDIDRVISEFPVTETQCLMIYNRYFKQPYLVIKSHEKMFHFNRSSVKSLSILKRILNKPTVNVDNLESNLPDSLTWITRFSSLKLIRFADGNSSYASPKYSSPEVNQKFLASAQPGPLESLLGKEKLLFSNERYQRQQNLIEYFVNQFTFDKNQVDRSVDKTFSTEPYKSKIVLNFVDSFKYKKSN